jgi:hypothetical protein
LGTAILGRRLSFAALRTASMAALRIAAFAARLNALLLVDTVIGSINAIA